jgi:hypothetical protein
MSRLIFFIRNRRVTAADHDTRKNGRQWPSKTLVTIPSEVYESGTVTQVLRIAELGEYRLYLSGKDGNQADFTREIPITVGTPWYEGITQLWPLLLLVVAAIVYHIFQRL